MRQVPTGAPPLRHAHSCTPAVCYPVASFCSSEHRPRLKAGYNQHLAMEKYGRNSNAGFFSITPFSCTILFCNSQIEGAPASSAANRGFLVTLRNDSYEVPVYTLLTYQLFSQNITVSADLHHWRTRAEQTRLFTCAFHPAPSFFHALQLILTRTIILSDKSANIFVKSSCRMSASHKLNYPARGSIQCLQQTFFCGSWVRPSAFLLLSLTLPIRNLHMLRCEERKMFILMGGTLDAD